MLTYTFIYSLPYTNHRQGRPDVKFEIEASLEGTMISFISPVDKDILNHEIMHRHITELARGEFNKMLRAEANRIKDGGRILNSLKTH